MARVSSGQDRYDLVIFGATGYTGSFTVEEVARTAVKNGVTWAVAARSKVKLEKVIQVASDATGLDLSNVPVILADVGNEQSLVNMARQARVLINTVGPYTLYGEAVVKACVENGTHHVDITGEIQWMEEMRLKYGELAKKNNVYVVGACGFDSIPTDMGVVYLTQKFQGDLDTAISYANMKMGPSGGPTLNDGTWKSLINAMSTMDTLKLFYRLIFKEAIPSYQKMNLSLLHRSKKVNSWCIPFLGPDLYTTTRSQQFFSDQYKQRPVRVTPYLQIPSFFRALLMLVGLNIIGIISQFEAGRSLLMKYPQIFSLGAVGKSDEMDRERDQKSTFTITLVGKGWGERLADAGDQHREAPDKTLTVKVKGANIGYGATNICLVQSAMTILKESEFMPGSGGVLTPAAAFSKTTIITRLNDLGVTFQVEQ